MVIFHTKDKENHVASIHIHWHRRITNISCGNSAILVGLVKNQGCLRIKIKVRTVIHISG